MRIIVFINSSSQNSKYFKTWSLKKIKSCFGQLHPVWGEADRMYNIISPKKLCK